MKVKRNTTIRPTKTPDTRAQTTLDMTARPLRRCQLQMADAARRAACGLQCSPQRKIAKMYTVPENKRFSRRLDDSFSAQTCPSKHEGMRFSKVSRENWLSVIYPGATSRCIWEFKMTHVSNYNFNHATHASNIRPCPHSSEPPCP